MVLVKRKIEPAVMLPPRVVSEASAPKWHPQSLMQWMCLLLACIGASWFAAQIFLVPQPARFAVPWQDSQWVQPADGHAQVAYFRYTTKLNTLPDAAFIIVTANQAFTLYVNGIFIAGTSSEIMNGKGLNTHIYDVASTLQTGTNVIAIRVSNFDKQMPLLRANFGLVEGSSIVYNGSGPGWQATTQSALVYPHYKTVATGNSLAWIKKTFDASTWPASQVAANAPSSPLLTENPSLYMHALAPQWMSAGNSHDAYFIRTISPPVGSVGTWLRIAATGPAIIFINGTPVISWHGEATIPSQDISQYLSDQESAVAYQQGLLVGLYDVSPYLHMGSNTIAVHVLAPGNSAAQTGLDTLNAALTMDIATIDNQNQAFWFPATSGWQASAQASNGWEQSAGSAIQSWSAPFLVGRPGATHSIYMLESTTSRNISIFPLGWLSVIILLNVGGVLGLWLLMSRLLRRRYAFSATKARQIMSVAYLPALACELLLIVLAYEPQMPQPFPYTWQWGLLLLLLVGLGYLLLWLQTANVRYWFSFPMVLARKWADARSGDQSTMRRAVRWLATHWGLLVLVLVAFPLIIYNLSYEPFWQDELTSYYAAKGILAHGLPFMPSSFLYAKGELYSYALALSIAIFGEQPASLRMIGVAEYLVSIPLFYFVGTYFSGRRIALLATTMLTFSPFVLTWGRQMRMYEQAQLLTILVMYLFYRAVREPRRPRFIYLAIATLVVTYLSHEESFILLPGLVVCILLASWMESRNERATQNSFKRFLPPILYQKHWWYATILGAILIGSQLLITKVSHPTLLGTDQSQRPLIQLSLTNVLYYFQQLFLSADGSQPWIVLNSLFAVIGCIWGIRRSDTRATYYGLFFFISLITLATIFTLTADRYIYPLLPALYLAGAYGLLNGLRAIWQLIPNVPEQERRTDGAQPVSPLWTPVRLVMAFTTTLVCISVLILPMLPISNYNAFVSKQLGTLYHRHYADYDEVGQYMHAHWQPGDIVIAVSPAISVLYYVGHVDYFFSVDRSLYLFEQNGRIVDTPTGSTPLLSQSDFQTVLLSHQRIWIISDNGAYQLGVTKTGRFTFPPDFHIVYEGYGSAVYTRGGD